MISQLGTVAFYASLCYYSPIGMIVLSIGGLISSGILITLHFRNKKTEEKDEKKVNFKGDNRNSKVINEKPPLDKKHSI